MIKHYPDLGNCIVLLIIKQYLFVIYMYTYDCYLCHIQRWLFLVLFASSLFGVKSRTLSHVIIKTILF